MSKLTLVIVAKRASSMKRSPFRRSCPTGWMVGIGRHALDAVEEDFLQRLRVRVFAAHADVGAARTILGLFTLITEHGEFLCFRALGEGSGNHQG